VDFETLRSRSANADTHDAARRTRAVVSPEMRARLLEWAGVSQGYPRQHSVVSLFEEQAQRTPHLAAIVGATGALPHCELNEGANRLAHEIREWIGRIAGDGARGGNAIGVCLERSDQTLVVLLAVLKAGYAYLPLDPASPRARLESLATQSRLAFVVT